MWPRGATAANVMDIRSFAALTKSAQSELGEARQGPDEDLEFAGEGNGGGSGRDNEALDIRLS